MREVLRLSPWGRGHPCPPETWGEPGSIGTGGSGPDRSGRAGPGPEAARPRVGVSPVVSEAEEDGVGPVSSRGLLTARARADGTSRPIRGSVPLQSAVGQSVRMVCRCLCPATVAVSRSPLREVVGRGAQTDGRGHRSCRVHVGHSRQRIFVKGFGAPEGPLSPVRLSRTHLALAERPSRACRRLGCRGGRPPPAMTSGGVGSARNSRAARLRAPPAPPSDALLPRAHFPRTPHSRSHLLQDFR